jgi:hypothetical protein
MNALINLLAQGVTFWGDGGGKVKGTATRPVCGSRGVARFFFSKSSAFRGTLPEGARVELAEANGQSALIIRAGGRAFATMSNLALRRGASVLRIPTVCQALDEEHNLHIQ